MVREKIKENPITILRKRSESMASLITHIFITSKLKERYDLLNEILLGCILPDIENKVGIKTKNKSHYINEEDNFLPDINLYIEIHKNMDAISTGILFHLIQDRIWYEMLNSFKSPKEQDKEFASLIYSDMDLCDNFILQETKTTNEEFYTLKKSLIEMTDTDIIKKGISENLKIRQVNTKKENFITIEAYRKYLNKAFDECQKYYQKERKTLNEL